MYLKKMCMHKINIYFNMKEIYIYINYCQIHEVQFINLIHNPVRWKRMRKLHSRSDIMI